MSKRRFAGPPDFNPEKFLAKEMKETKAAKVAGGRWDPIIAFSASCIEAVIARVEAETPEARQPLYLSPTIWKKAVEAQLAELGVAPDPILVQFLVGSVVLSPEYRKWAGKRPRK
jgi:hypothetical protein